MAGLALLLAWLGQGARAQEILEVKEIPSRLASSLEGLYTPWHARWINGRVWKRSNVGLNSKGGVTPPTFFGPFCRHVYGGSPTDWCFAECDEELMLKTTGLYLPCGTDAPDGTVCPPQPPPPPAGSGEEQPKAYFCDVLGHARRFHEAGFLTTAEPPSPEWWRFRMATNDWVSAIGTSGSFEVQPRREADEPAPGERLTLRRDGTVRPLAHPGFCLGAEGGRVVEGTRMLFWDCGPHPHEFFDFAQGRGSTEIRPRDSRSLCVGANGDGKVARLVLCEGSLAETITSFRAAADGTVRAASAPALCLGSGPDRPYLGSELKLESCTRPMPRDDNETALHYSGGCAAPYPVGGPRGPGDDGPGAGERAAGGAEPGSVALEGLRQSLEAQMSLKMGRLEQEVADLRESRSRASDPFTSQMSQVLQALESFGNSSVQGQYLVSRTAQLEEEMAKLRALVAQEEARKQRRTPPSRTPCKNCD